MSREKWDEKHRASGGSLPPDDVVVKAASLVRPGRALDIACGTGRNSVALADLGWKVTAIDYSKVAIEILSERAPGVEARVCDLESAEFSLNGEQFDLICDARYLWRPLFPLIRRAVSPGGLFVGRIAVKNDLPDPHPMPPEFQLEPGELRSIFSDWEILHFHEETMAELIARRPAVRISNG